MTMSTLELAFMCILGLALVQRIQSQNTPQDYLVPHNAARSLVGVGSMVWNTTVAAYAQGYADKQNVTCNMVHSGGPYGENLAWSSGDMSAATAVNLWVAEKQYYTYSSNSCAAGQQCGHYTQVVWRNSVQLGCGRVRCNSGATLIVCNYSPRGNYIGQWLY